MSSPYNYYPSTLGYRFTTKNDITYEVYFIEYPDLFSSDPSISSVPLTFGFSPIAGDRRLVPDKSIEVTIVDIISEFLTKANSPLASHHPEKGEIVTAS